MRRFALCILGLGLLATSGCATPHYNLEPFEVSHVDIETVPNSTFSVEAGAIVEHVANKKQLTVEITNTTEMPMSSAEFTVCQLANGSAPWPACTVEVERLYISDGTTRFKMTALLDERPLGDEDIIVEIRAGGRKAFVVFHPLNPICYRAFKYTERGKYRQDYGTWTFLYHRHLREECDPEHVPVATTQVRG